ncbi:hypothetical protein GCM10018793_23770 [Streptomyces sulfonofaciens]|uniref:Histidyl-tRNA synthetase n=1 Tax=Streptomyces sulfonofaciens TaxID=68272 RepID=A0A919G2V0_9ACTN|nr:hypothetical protein GCM10018793_23770 [Streptomyces sulfonofaciens]
MRSIESRVPRFFDILDDESRTLRRLEACFISTAESFGFREIRTAAVEVRDRYLAATRVHPSRIFEVHRPKEGSRFVLQADLAMGMSRFVADLPSPTPLKLAQVSSVFRDRQLDVPGWRRQFDHAVLGTWGLPSPHADAEILTTAHEMLAQVPGVDVAFIQFANAHVFARLAPDLAQEIRFSGKDIEGLLAGTSLTTRDRELVTALFRRGRMPLAEFRASIAPVEDARVREEAAALLATAAETAEALPGLPMYVNLADLHGTGHYSGVTYQMFLTAPGRAEPFSMIDGGRIDHLCRAFNSRDVPAACLGISLTVLANLCPAEPPQRKVILLVECPAGTAGPADCGSADAAADSGSADTAPGAGPQRSVAGDIRSALRDHGVQSSVMRLPRRKWSAVFKSEFYAGHGFVLVEGDRITVRHPDADERQAIQELLSSHQSGTWVLKV